jgi:hypothetical protein
LQPNDNRGGPDPGTTRERLRGSKMCLPPECIACAYNLMAFRNNQ